MRCTMGLQFRRDDERACAVAAPWFNFSWEHPVRASDHTTRIPPRLGQLERTGPASTGPRTGSSPPATPHHPAFEGALRGRSAAQADGHRAFRAALPAPTASHHPRALNHRIGRPGHSTPTPAPGSPVRSPDTYVPLHSPATFGRLGRLPNVVGVIDNSAGMETDPRLGNHARQGMAEPFIRCADGKIRRFPPGAPHEFLAHAMIHDVPADRVTHHIGGLEISQDHRHAAFMFDGFAVSPLQVGSFNAYPLPGNRFMVPQPGANDCSAACEMMMLLDHGAVSIDNPSAKVLTGERRSKEAVLASIEANTGVKPVVVEHKLNYRSSIFGGVHSSRKEAWRDLGQKIREMGPCMLTKAGHSVMLDGVREENGKFFLTIRDPYHGTIQEFEDTSKFFPDMGKRTEASLEAIFMGKPR